MLLKRIEESEQLSGGIIIPDSAKEKSQQAEVIALGTSDAPFNVKVGATVLLPKYGGSPVKEDGVEYILIEEDDLLGVVTE